MKRLRKKKREKMKVTVRDCLQLDSFKNCIVVAGEGKIDNRVKAVSVMDAANADEAVKCGGGEGMMALTTFAGMKNDIEAQCETIRKLAEAGVAAMVYFPREHGVKSVDNEVISAADEAGIPFVVMVGNEAGDYSSIISATR